MPSMNRKSKKVTQEPDVKKIVMETLDDIKAINIVTIDVKPLTTITDTMIICSGTSNRHTKSIANNVVKAAKKNKIRPLGIEGEKDGEWILVDLGDLLIHIMLPQTREFYALEKLWDPIEVVDEVVS